MPGIGQRLYGAGSAAVSSMRRGGVMGLMSDAAQDFGIMKQSRGLLDLSEGEMMRRIKAPAAAGSTDYGPAIRADSRSLNRLGYENAITRQISAGGERGATRIDRTKLDRTSPGVAGRAVVEMDPTDPGIRFTQSNLPTQVMGSPKARSMGSNSGGYMDHSPATEIMSPQVPRPMGPTHRGARPKSSAGGPSASSGGSAIRSPSSAFGRGAGGMGGVAGGMALGGAGAYMTGDGSMGSIGGGMIAGGAGGGGASYMAGKRAFSGAVVNANKRLGNSRYGTSVTRSAFKGARSMETKSSRSAMFAAGGMLGGGAFGSMFGGEGRSHRRGFNQHRGNTFSR